MQNPLANPRFKDLPNVNDLVNLRRRNVFLGTLPNDGYIVGIPKNIENNITTVNSAAGPGLSTLHTFSLPGGSLNVNGAYIDILYGGIYAQNNNDKRVNASFGGTGYEDIGLHDVDGNLNDFGWTLFARITRITSTSVFISSGLFEQVLLVDSANVVNAGTIGSSILVRGQEITGLSDLSLNAMTVLLQGEGTAAADVVKRKAQISLTRF